MATARRGARATVRAGRGCGARDARRRGEAAARRGRDAGERRGRARAAARVDLDDEDVDAGYVPGRDDEDADALERVEASGTARSSSPGEVWVPEDLVDLRGKSARQWSPIALAFLGDAVFELYARGVFFYPPAKPLEYDLKTKRLARAEAQDFLLRLLIDGDALSEEEVSIVKWGRNAAYGNIPTRLKGKGKGGHGTYRNASALECLVGYLYVVDRARLQEVMTIVMSETAIEGALALSSK